MVLVGGNGGGSGRLVDMGANVPRSFTALPFAHGQPPAMAGGPRSATAQATANAVRRIFITLSPMEHQPRCCS